MADELFPKIDDDANALVRGSAWNQLVDAVSLVLRSFQYGEVPYFDGASGFWQMPPKFEYGIYRLTESLDRTGTATCNELIWDGTTLVKRTTVPTVEISGKFTRGYHFNNDDIWAVEIDGTLFCVTPGHFLIRGTLESDLVSGGTSSMTVTALDGSGSWVNRESVNVTEAIGLSSSIASGTVILAQWHEQSTLWIATNAPC